MDPKMLGAYLFAAAFDIGMPIALAIYLRRRLGVPWRLFWYGALIFFVFQMVTRIPAVQILQIALAEPLRRSVELQWAWLFGLALTAGIFEEVGRYLGYRFLIFRGARRQWNAANPHPNPLPLGEGRGEGVTHHSSPITHHSTQSSGLSPQSSPPYAWRKGVMYGLGHGGLESMLLVGGSVILATINALVVLRMDPASVAALPQDQQEAVRQAQVILGGIPWWYPLLGAFERLCTVGVQIAFSILVLQVFLRGSIRWLYLAIGAHFLVDLIAVVAVRQVGAVGAEGVIGLFALASVYLIYRLRPGPLLAAAPGLGGHAER